MYKYVFMNNQPYNEDWEDMLEGIILEFYKKIEDNGASIVSTIVIEPKNN